jgi:thiosulfate/3-mercaptopyruvate sulfurtransferase
MSLTILLSLLPVFAEPKPATYPKAELLIEAGELQKLERGKVRLLDTRARQDHEAGHIPGAVWVDVAAWSKSFNAGPEMETFTKYLSAVGISDLATPVVVYGADLRDSARTWWILRYWGLRDVRLLHGGWKAWRDNKGKIEEGPGPDIRAAEGLKLAPVAKRHATLKDLLDDLKSQPQIVDARTTDEFCGEASTAKRNGAMPGAVHLDWQDLIDHDTQRFKPREELEKLFKRAGIDVAKPVTTYCQSGGRASVMAFALELMGGTEVRNYYRSWAEWGNNPETPIVKPKK